MDDLLIVHKGYIPETDLEYNWTASSYWRHGYDFQLNTGARIILGAALPRGYYSYQVEQEHGRAVTENEFTGLSEIRTSMNEVHARVKQVLPHQGVVLDALDEGEVARAQAEAAELRRSLSSVFPSYMQGPRPGYISPKAEIGFSESQSISRMIGLRPDRLAHDVFYSAVNSGALSSEGLCNKSNFKPSDTFRVSGSSVEIHEDFNLYGFSVEGDLYKKMPPPEREIDMEDALPKILIFKEL